MAIAKSKSEEVVSVCFLLFTPRVLCALSLLNFGLKLGRLEFGSGEGRSNLAGTDGIPGVPLHEYATMWFVLRIPCYIMY